MKKYCIRIGFCLWVIFGLIFLCYGQYLTDGEQYDQYPDSPEYPPEEDDGEQDDQYPEYPPEEPEEEEGWWENPTPIPYKTEDGALPITPPPSEPVAEPVDQLQEAISAISNTPNAYAYTVSHEVVNRISLRESKWVFVLSYEDWSYRNIDGKSYLLSSGYERSFEKWGIGVLVPIKTMSLENTFEGGDSFTQIGVAPYAYWQACPLLKLGGFVEIDRNFTDIDGIEEKFSTGSGVFGVLEKDFEFCACSFAAAYTFWWTDISGFEDSQNLIIGPKVNIPLGKSFMLSLFGYYTKEFENDTIDDTFYEIGGEFEYRVGEAWGLRVGYKTVEGSDDYDSDMFFLGTNLRF